MTHRARAIQREYPHRSILLTAAAVLRDVLVSGHGAVIDAVLVSPVKLRRHIRILDKSGSGEKRRKKGGSGRNVGGRVTHHAKRMLPLALSQDAVCSPVRHFAGTFFCTQYQYYNPHLLRTHTVEECRQCNCHAKQYQQPRSAPGSRLQTAALRLRQ